MYLLYTFFSLISMVYTNLSVQQSAPMLNNLVYISSPMYIKSADYENLDKSFAFLYIYSIKSLLDKQKFDISTFGFCISAFLALLQDNKIQKGEDINPNDFQLYFETKYTDGYYFNMKFVNNALTYICLDTKIFNLFLKFLKEASKYHQNIVNDLKGTDYEIHTFYYSKMLAEYTSKMHYILIRDSMYFLRSNKLEKKLDLKFDLNIESSETELNSEEESFSLSLE